MDSSTGVVSVESPMTQSDLGVQPNDKGLVFTLSEGKELTQTAQPLPIAETQPLAPDLLQQLLGRLPALEVQGGDVQDFRLPAETLKPPRPGVTVEQSFPPTSTVEATAPEVQSDVLKVLRYAPSGEIKIAPFLQVTFNQPMVPLATLDQLKEIERLVMLRDTSALGSYLSANIEVTEGDDALSVELRKFLQCTRAGDLNCFDATRLPGVPKEPARIANAIY